ncbi:unnamed protein product [Adineta steineri]|uniref:Uncharacterized protein n=1 Tax=Adineta steineri TaxID=433720 RepID=A0A815K343_9BILA|nr:unnamed protein product [Adineta steineri]CAF1387892.1 unnamed protein product [Adineta steineri]
MLNRKSDDYDAPLDGRPDLDHRLRPVVVRAGVSAGCLPARSYAYLDGGDSSDDADSYYLDVDSYDRDGIYVGKD